MQEENILENVKQIRNYFKNLHSFIDIGNRKQAVNELLSLCSDIINENLDKEQHKNIGTKINKFNYKKYVSCKEKMNKIKSIVDGMEKLQGAFWGLSYRIELDIITDTQKQVEHKISTYGIKNYKDKYNV